MAAKKLATGESRVMLQLASTTPNDFTELGQISNAGLGTFRNVMGVLSDALPPRITAKKEWQSTVRLTDHSLQGQGLQVVFFNESNDNVPTARIGDVLIVFSVKVNSFRNERQLVSAKQRTDWILIPAAAIVSLDRCVGLLQDKKTLEYRNSSAADPPTAHQQLRACCLGASQNAVVSGGTVADCHHKPLSSNDHVQTHNKNEPAPAVVTVVNGPDAKAAGPSVNVQVTGPRDKKAALVKDVKDRQFCNLTGQIVKMVGAGSSVHGDIVDVYLTDFTQNSALYDYQPTNTNSSGTGQHGWRGPFGKYALKIECHEPHGSWLLHNSSEGQIVTLTNVRIKHGRDNGFLEANIFLDKMFPGRIHAYKPAMVSPLVVNLLERRTSYQSRAVKDGHNNLVAVSDGQGTKLKDKIDSQALMSDRKKKNKKTAKRAREPDDDDDDTSVPFRNDVAKRQKDTRLNPSVSVSNAASDTRLCKMGDVVNNSTRVLKVDGAKHDLPFVNCRYMLHMRVVDFFPHDMHDFCRHATVETGKGSVQQWIWGFGLMLVAAGDSEDSCKEHVLVEVSHREAQRFLGLAPQDLRSNANATVYSSLVRKLRLLWGDLDEVKQAYFAASNIEPSTHGQAVYREGLAVQGNRPFECCIEEFGLPVSPSADPANHDGDTGELHGWRRHYKLCETFMT